MRRQIIALLVVLVLGGQLLMPATPAAASTVRCNHGRWFQNADLLWVFLPVNTGLLSETNCFLQQGHYDNFGVVALQNTLVKCYGQDIAADGDFGPATGVALQRAQAWEFVVNAKWQVDTNGVYTWTKTGAYLMWPYHERSTETDRYDCLYKTR